MKAPKILAGILESVAAAVYVDTGFSIKKKWKSGRLVSFCILLYLKYTQLRTELPNVGLYSKTK